MSYQSYALDEMKRANIESHIQSAVVQALTDIDAMGHSGGSIDVYLQMVTRWCRNARTVVDQQAHINLLPEQFHAAIKGLSRDDINAMMMLVNSLGRFEPLSPLTGDDDEWIDQSGPTGSPFFQNRRCMTVFKEGLTEQAYHAERHLFAYPSSCYTGWHLTNRGRELSSRQITFPYDVLQHPTEVTYHTHDGWEEPLPAGIDSDIWLQWMRDRYVKGIDPTTNRVREEAMFVQYDGETREVNGQTNFFIRLTTLLCHLKYNPEATTAHVIQRLGWLADNGEPFVAEWSEPGDESDDVHTFKMVIADTVIAHALARMLGLIQPDWQYMVSGQQLFNYTYNWGASLFWNPVNQREYRLDWRQVFVADKNYQRWLAVKPDGAYFDPTVINHLTNVTVPDYKEQGTDGKAFYYDKPHQITGDHEDYLYQKRRELGLAHPRRRLNLTMSESDSNPVATVNAIVDVSRNQHTTKKD